MNRDPVVRRMLHVVAAVLFVLAANGEAFGLHRPCPHHEDGHGAAVSGSGVHAGHTAHEAHGRGESGEDPEHGPCSCLGSCVAAAAAAAPAAEGAETALVAPEATRRIVPDLVVPAPAGPREHRLPFPNGPPLD